MDQLVGQKEDFLSVARAHARDADILCLDVAVAIFPSALHPASEATISGLSVKLLTIIRDIEAVLSDGSNDPQIWQLLARSGFLREPDLVDFALARVAEDRFEALLGIDRPLLLTRLLDHANGNVVNAAKVLLAADSLHRHSKGASYRAMPPELLHKTVWRVVAAIEVTRGTRSALVIDAARNIIASYDEAATASVAARKLVHFVGPDVHGSLRDPKQAGLHLFVAALSAQVSLDHDHILRIIDFDSALPLIVMLAGAGFPKGDALSLVLGIRTQKLTPREAAFFEAEYAGIDADVARQEIITWAAARSSLLTFGRP